MTPEQAQQSFGELQQEEMKLFREREIKQEQRAQLDTDIHCITQRLIALRAAREGYMLATLANSPPTESTSGPH